MNTIDCTDEDAVLAVLTDAALAAGEIALGYFRLGEQTAARIDYKQGDSPVTEADLEVDRFLCDKLRAALPDAAWLSEETRDDLSRLDFSHVIVVDPIDGTRGFAAGDPRWAVSIALVTEGRPVAGVVHVPAAGLTYAARRGGGAGRNGVEIHATQRGVLGGASLAAPAGFIKPLARMVPVELGDKMPSLACRFAAVAAGDIDCAVASPNAHDWDIAAVDLIVHEAGGRLSSGDGLPVTYNRRQPRHPTLYAAGPQLHPVLLTAARRTLGSGA